MLRPLIISCCLAAALAACAPSDPASGTVDVPREISVLDIIDGDTIRIAGKAPGETLSVRLMGYDAPEVTEPGCPEELALGHTATRRLQTILYDAKRIDSVPQGVDRNQRVLLHLVIDGRDLAAIMVAEGLAVRYSGGQRINWCRKLSAP